MPLTASFSSFNADDKLPFLTQTDYYDEGMPRRAYSEPELPNLLATENSWGIHHSRSQTTLAFPSRVSSLVNDLINAIVGTLNGKQKLDPNFVLNAVIGNNTVGRRPVRRFVDAGRMGIELDGLVSLFDGQLSEPNALRKVALRLAAEISTAQGISVAIYFNTIRQTLAASQELQFLRRIEKHTKNNLNKDSVYNNITVLTLGADDLPLSMLQERLPRQQVSQGVVDSNRGLVLVIQPTDYNAEYRPPGPSIGSVAALQKLAGRASLNGIPVILLSPRFMTLRSPNDGWDQSGYQQSSAYGGFEPPRGPTPWIMRDFSPPIYSWSGKTMTVPVSEIFRDEAGSMYQYSHIALMQSVMIEGHSWHVFAKRRRAASSRQKDDYVYLASTQASAGRPTQEVLQRIYHEFAM
jgi:hypothetical protein